MAIYENSVVEQKEKTTRNWFCYRYLDLPKVPDHIVQAALDFAHDPEKCKMSNSMQHNVAPKNENIWFRPLNVFGVHSNARSIIRFDFSKEFVDWVRSNITENFLDANLACSFASNCDDTVSGMHSDIGRNFVLLYLIEKTNDDQKTAWWHQSGHPVVRNYDVQVDNFESANLIEETVFEKFRWVLMNANILHSVHNVKGNRMALQVSLSVMQAAKLLK